MKTVIKVVPLATEGEAPQAGSGGSFAAGIDTDIFEADSLALEGERFWEAFWQTQHAYGGVSEGQALVDVLRSLDEAILAKMHHDVQRVVADLAVVPDDEANDILGMMSFLLCMERGDPRFDPFGGENGGEAMTRFVDLVAAERQRREGGG